MLTRRSLLGGILAATVAPVFIKSGILMPSRALILPLSMELLPCDDGKVVYVHNDTTFSLPINDMLPLGAIITIASRIPARGREGVATVLKVSSKEWILTGDKIDALRHFERFRRPRAIS